VVVIGEIAFVAIGGGAVLAIILADAFGFGLGLLWRLLSKRRAAKRLVTENDPSHD